MNIEGSTLGRVPFEHNMDLGRGKRQGNVAQLIEAGASALWLAGF